MPIKHLTDRPASFPRIGILRKGSPKQQKNGREIYGKDLEGFRFDTKDPEALETFGAAYGDEPRQINIFLPYATTDENFQAWKEAWTASSLQHRCDGETCVTWLDKKTGRYRSDPLSCPGGCKEVGRLMVIVPELRRMAYVQVETHSINDIVEIQQNLLALEQSRGTLRGIPLILSRRPREISTPRDEGKRARVTKWLLHIEAAPRWVDLQLAAQERQALAELNPALRMLPGADIVDSESGEILEGAAAPAPNARMIRALVALWEEEHSLGGETPEEDLTADLDALSQDQLIQRGKAARARVLALKESAPAAASPSAEVDAALVGHGGLAVDEDFIL